MGALQNSGLVNQQLESKIPFWSIPSILDPLASTDKLHLKIHKFQFCLLQLNLAFSTIIMLFKSLVVAGLVGTASAALRGVEQDNEVQLDLEVVVEGGERQLFPLLPGTKCPTGHHCRVRTTSNGMNPMMNSLKDNLKTPLAATLDWQELNNNLNTVVASNDYCSRRSAMARAAGLAAGVSLATVSQPAYAAETKDVKMGSDSGQLVFVPAKTTICSGDSVKWYV